MPHIFSTSEFHLELATEMGRYVVHCLLQLLFGSPLERHPAALHQPPQRLDVVELSAVGRQKLQRDALFLQQFERRLDRSRTVNRRVVDHDDQGLGGSLGQLPNKAQEDLCGAAAPVVRMDHRAVVEQCSHHIQALPARGLRTVLLATNASGAVVGVDLRKARLVEVGQINLAPLIGRPRSNPDDAQVSSGNRLLSGAATRQCSLGFAGLILCNT